MKRRMLFLIGLMTTAGVVVATDRPNFLFIMADDLGINDLACYGSDYYRTPALDGLAEEGMRFTQAYAAANVCSPTRAALLTGCYPHRVHLTDALPWDRLAENPKMIPPNHLKELPADLPMVGKSLRAAGYRTALFGKWHLGNEHRFFTQGEHSAYGFDEALDCSGKEKKRDKGVEELTEMTIRFLRENKDEPFALFLMHHVPHVPMAAPPEAKALYDGVPKGKHQKNQTYAGMVSHMDQSVGKILDTLDKLNLAENTLVVFTSDNGGLKNLTSNRPFRAGKGDVYEGGNRVPLIIRWPKNVPAGTTCGAPVISMDFYPTFLDAVGLEMEPKAHRDGRNMMPLFGGDTPEPRELVWHFPHRDRPASAILKGDWKLVRHILTGKVELYQLKDDLSESNDLSKAFPERTEELTRMLERNLAATGAQRMRPNLQWDQEKPAGKMKNYGVFYPSNGHPFQVIKEKPPTWFAEENETNE